MEIVVPVLAYLFGSVPVGVLLTHSSGVDLRTTGSGNIGATNVARTAGRFLALATLVGDALKGLLPVLFARALELPSAVVAVVAVCAVAGHVFPLFLGFHGGKGVSTGFGVVLGLAPPLAPLLIVVFGAILAWTRIVSASSLTVALATPIALAGFGYPRSYQIAGLAIGLLVAYRHRDNLERLRSGTEPRVGGS